VAGADGRGLVDDGDGAGRVGLENDAADAIVGLGEIGGVGTGDGDGNETDRISARTGESESLRAARLGDYG